MPDEMRGEVGRGQEPRGQVGRGQVDHDPRWEVQPEAAGEDDRSGSALAVLVALLAAALFVALLVWRVVDDQPAF